MKLFCFIYVYIAANEAGSIHSMTEAGIVGNQGCGRENGISVQAAIRPSLMTILRDFPDFR